MLNGPLVNHDDSIIVVTIMGNVYYDQVVGRMGRPGMMVLCCHYDDIEVRLKWKDQGQVPMSKKKIGRKIKG